QTRRTLLHSESLARIHHCIRDRCTHSLRLVARYAPEQQCSRRSALADYSLWHAAFPRSRCGGNRVLFRVLDWRAVENHAPRAKPVHLTLRRSIWNPGDHEEAEVITCIPVFMPSRSNLILSVTFPRQKSVAILPRVANRRAGSPCRATSS